MVVVGLILLALTWITAPFSDAEGELDFMLYDEEETLIIDETYRFYEGDTLFAIIDRHHDTVCADRSYDPDPSCDATFGDYGRVLLGIDEVLTDWSNTFLYLEMNGSKAEYGVDNIPLEDGGEYVFRHESAD